MRKFVPVLSFIAGVATWATWLSWGFDDRQYSTSQVAGCAIMAGVLCIVLTWITFTRRAFITVALPMALGLTVAWTAWAASDDDSGMFGVGAIMMAIGTSVALMVVETITRIVRGKLVSHSRQ